MKAYIISIIITSILIALTELILPQGRLKSVVNTVFSLTMLLVTISPLSNIEADISIPTFNQSQNNNDLDTEYLNDYFEVRLENYYADLFQKQLFRSDLITEKIIVDIKDMQIENVQIFLSNLVIPEENTHINNNVIANYVSDVLGISVKKVEIYV